MLRLLWTDPVPFHQTQLDCYSSSYSPSLFTVWSAHLSVTDWTFLLIDIDVRAPAPSSDSAPICGEHRPMGSRKMLKEATSPGTLDGWKCVACSETAVHLPSGLRQPGRQQVPADRGSVKLKSPESYCHS